MSATIVLVHGAWHGAWCWDRVADQLGRAGHEVVAVDLPGHGDDPGPLADLHGDAAAVRTVLDGLASAGREVVLVGHSYGGAVITEAGEHPAVRHLVYVAAFAIDEGETCATACADDPRVADISHEGRPNLGDAFLAGDDGAITLDPDQVEACFYHLCDPAAVGWAIERLGPQPAVTFSQSPAAVAWRTRPATYAVCDQDRAVHPDLQRLMATRCSATVVWPADHSPFLSTPQPVVELLADLAEA